MADQSTPSPEQSPEGPNAGVLIFGSVVAALLLGVCLWILVQIVSDMASQPVTVETDTSKPQPGNYPTVASASRAKSAPGPDADSSAPAAGADGAAATPAPSSSQTGSDSGKSDPPPSPPSESDSGSESTQKPSR